MDSSGRPPALARTLVLIGFMGAGKSTALRELATALQARALDSDLLLEQELGHTIATEFELHGEPAFRAREERLVSALLEGAGPGQVIALGGGAILSERVQRALKAHLTVLLDVDPDTAWARVQGADRPLARDRERFRALHAQRRPLYERLADAYLPVSGTDERCPRSVALAALGALGALAEAPPGTKLAWARSASGEYPVLVGQGLLDSLKGPLGLPLDPGSGRSFCVSDEIVAPIYAPRLQAPEALIVIPAGESHKTPATAQRVWRELAVAGMTRADRLIALGGGVVGDLAGFCAATYQRGVPVVQIPTSLIAQVDSAYGGKTGVDLPEAKNYVGAYHQPAAVIVDPGVLVTLPAAELSSGYAEVLKTALIAGGELWRRVAADEPIDQWTILACARTKLAIVQADERDDGRRQLLNLGHTVGHAIETATGYARYRHGEAIGLGLLAALRLGGRAELRDRVHELLRAHDLPVRLHDADLETVLEAITRDKKRIGAHVPFVLVDAPGEVRRGREVPDTDVRAAVAELL